MIDKFKKLLKGEKEPEITKEQLQQQIIDASNALILLKKELFIWKYGVADIIREGLLDEE